MKWLLPSRSLQQILDSGVQLTSVSQCIPPLGSREKFVCLDRSKMLWRFRIVKLLRNGCILEHFWEEMVCALYLKNR